MNKMQRERKLGLKNKEDEACDGRTRKVVFAVS